MYVYRTMPSKRYISVFCSGALHSSPISQVGNSSALNLSRCCSQRCQCNTYFYWKRVFPFLGYLSCRSIGCKIFSSYPGFDSVLNHRSCRETLQSLWSICVGVTQLRTTFHWWSVYEPKLGEEELVAIIASCWVTRFFFHKEGVSKYIARDSRVTKHPVLGDVSSTQGRDITTP